MDDWLYGEGDAQETQRAAAVSFAQAYMVFVEDSRARELLSHWDKTLRRRRVPVNASIQEYAANEALRDFIEKIYQQIEFAQNDGRLT